jgi:hypothetical protein
LRLGDLFDSPADVIVLPMATSGSVTAQTLKDIRRHGLPEPEGGPFELGSVIFRPRTVRQTEDESYYVAFAASVHNNSSTPASIEEIGVELARFAFKRPQVKTIAVPLLGAGAGKLPASQVIDRLVTGFQKPASRAYLIVHVLNRRVFEQISRTFQSSKQNSQQSGSPVAAPMPTRKPAVKKAPKRKPVAKRGDSEKGPKARQTSKSGEPSEPCQLTEAPTAAPAPAPAIAAVPGPEMMSGLVASSPSAPELPTIVKTNPTPPVIAVVPWKYRPPADKHLIRLESHGQECRLTFGEVCYQSPNRIDDGDLRSRLLLTTDYGEALFRAVIRAEDCPATQGVSTLVGYDKAMEETCRQARFELDLDSNVPELLPIRWEYLKDSRMSSPVAVHERTAFYRRVGSKDISAVPSPWKILVVISNPPDLGQPLDCSGRPANRYIAQLAPLDHVAERRTVEEALTPLRHLHFLSRHRLRHFGRRTPSSSGVAAAFLAQSPQAPGSDSWPHHLPRATSCRREFAT